MSNTGKRGDIIDISGFDFTSSPRSAKPITQCCCFLTQDTLKVITFHDHKFFESFEEELGKPGPWVAGFDFPFGQSRKFVGNIGWPKAWKEYAELLNEISKQEFTDLLNHYKNKRPSGDKEHRRITDKKAGSISPQKLYGVPVGKMFYEGARRLVRSEASIIPVRLTDDNRTIVEAYPALIARKAIGRAGYKSDTKKKQTHEHYRARQRIVKYLFTSDFTGKYRLQLSIDDYDIDRIINGPTGDQLDALLCAIQAAWAWQMRHDNYGVPGSVDTLEGWIIDPEMLDS